MFFIMGMSQGHKKLNFDQLVICRNCGKYGHLEVFLTYSYLSLFFIPIFKWGKQYVVRTTCCGTVIPLDPETGRKIERGEITSLPEDIIPQKDPQSYGTFTGHKKCVSCGYETDENFQFCPKCGQRF